MIYSARVVERVQDPKNAGIMNNDDPEVGVGIVGSPACGDVLQLFIRVQENKIVEAKFQAFGCGSAIAASQLATEQIPGMNVNDSGFEGMNERIFDYLGLPPVKLHCSILAEEAIHAAIKNYIEKQNSNSQVIL